MELEPVHLLVNRSAAAGRAGRAVGAITAQLGAGGREVRVLPARSRHEALEAVGRAVAGGAWRLVVAGGDGLVHDVVPLLVGSATELGVVPVGSGNDFARALGVADLGLAACCEVATGPARRFDALRCEASAASGAAGGASAGPPAGDGSGAQPQRELSEAGWAASVVTAGFSGQVSDRAGRLRFPPGRARYTAATLLELPRLARRAWRLVVDGVVHEVDGVLVAVANTGYFGGGMAICPDADPADGLLDVGVVGGVGRAQLLRFFPQVFRGAHVDHPDFHAFRGVQVAVAADDDVEVWADGERLGRAPLTFTVEPGALRVAALGASVSPAPGARPPRPRPLPGETGRRRPWPGRTG